MNTRNCTSGHIRTFAPARFAAGIFMAFSLLLAGCGDTPSPTSSPALSSGTTTGLPGVTATPPALSKPGVLNGNGSQDRFALLGNAAVTATDATITGDVGTNEPTPTGAVVLTNSPLTGTIHVGDAVAVQAYDDFLATYAAITPDVGDSLLTGTLSGVTLAPGSYYFDAAATLTGVLTLDGPANGVWIFKVGTLGTGALTGTNFSVVMAGGANACNVTWWVAEAVTMTDSDFQGNLLAGEAITLTRGTLNGNAWSQAGVTVTGTAVNGCECGNGNGNGNNDGHGDKDHHGNDNDKYNQGIGNGPDGGDPGHSNHNQPSNDEDGELPGSPGRKGGK
jgi:hypothetical protein